MRSQIVCSASSKRKSKAIACDSRSPELASCRRATRSAGARPAGPRSTSPPPSKNASKVAENESPVGRRSAAVGRRAAHAVRADAPP
eukprot:scaffold19592_cov112-Isochrysis_galbana.AAC.3